jgi:hypothetical protein
MVVGRVVKGIAEDFSFNAAELEQAELEDLEAFKDFQDLFKSNSLLTLTSTVSLNTI